MCNPDCKVCKGQCTDPDYYQEDEDGEYAPDEWDEAEYRRDQKEDR